MARKKAAPADLPPAEDLLFWDFQNVLSDQAVSWAVGASLHPRVLSGLAGQTGGGPAETWDETGVVFLTRFLGTQTPFLWITTTRPLLLAAATFRHWHNHNRGFPTAGGYQVQLTLDSGCDPTDIGKPLPLNNRNSGSVATMEIGAVLPPGGHRLRWQPRKLKHGSDTNTEFFAVKDLTLTGRLLEAGTAPPRRPPPAAAPALPASTLGSISAAISDGCLDRFVTQGAFQDEPELSGDFDFEYNSWRITAPGSHLALRFSRPEGVERLAVGVVWAGWGERTRAALTVNGRSLAANYAVHGSAWNDPKDETFPIPPDALQDHNTLTLTLERHSPMVLFLREITLRRLEG